MTLLERVQDALRRRDEAATPAMRDRAGAPPATIRRRAVGYRRVIAVEGVLDHAAITELVEAFWDAIEAGAREVWIKLSTSGPLPPGALEALARLNAFGHAFARRTALIVPPGPAHDAAALKPGLRVYDSVASAHSASR